MLRPADRPRRGFAAAVIVAPLLPPDFPSLSRRATRWCALCEWPGLPAQRMGF